MPFAHCTAGDWSEWADNTYDVVLSSGFLAFASHSGFLKAIDNAGLAVSGVMGTSAGALTGSLYCAGYSPDEVFSLFVCLMSAHEALISCHCGCVMRVASRGQQADGVKIPQQRSSSQLRKSRTISSRSSSSNSSSSSSTLAPHDQS